MRIFVLLVSIFFGGRLVSGELETRLHSFSYAPPELVERQLRVLIPESPRVSMNPRANQVIVIADAETHDKVASMLRELGRPTVILHFRVRHNRVVRQFSVMDGLSISLPVSQTPPRSVVDHAKSRLALEKQKLPVVGSALQVQAKLLREDPAVVRLRVLPAVLFGKAPPYEVVDYKELAMDILITTESYLELQESLAGHDFYSRFLRTQPDVQRSPRPVSLLMSFERLSFVGEEKEAARVE
jgi:hypothetical protein